MRFPCPRMRGIQYAAAYMRIFSRRGPGCRCRSPGRRPAAASLIAQAEALQQRRCLGILHRRVPGSGVGYGRHLRILLLPDPCPMISLGLDLCSCIFILHGLDPPLLFRGPDLGWGLLHRPDRSSLHGLCGPGLCPCPILRRPSLELLEQGFSEWLADLGLALTGLGSALADLGLALISRFYSRNALRSRFNRRSNFVARRRVRCRRRRIPSVGD